MNTSHLVIILLLFYPYISNTQVIWSENFNSYFSGTQTGFNINTANPANDWQTFCSTCSTGDYLAVNSGQLQGRDTNGNAFWLSEEIDISSCGSGVILSLSVSETGTLEGCSNCSSADFFDVAVNIDGGGYNSLGTAPCFLSCTPSPSGVVVVSDDFGAGTFTSPCIYGNSLRLLVIVRTMADSETIQFDNVNVTCSPGSCLSLPVELINWQVQDKKTYVDFKWKTASNEDLAYFELEESKNAIDFEVIKHISAPDNEQETSFHYKDERPFAGDRYYRLKIYQKDGDIKYAPLKTLNRALASSSVNIYPLPADKELNIELQEVIEDGKLELINVAGQQVALMNIKQQQLIKLKTANIPAGVYFLKINNTKITYQQKILIEH